MIPTITEDDFMTELRAFLLLVIPAGVEVIQTQGNRVPPPVGDDFVILTPKSRVRLSTNTGLWDFDDPAPDHLEISFSAQITIQLDIHGPRGSDIAQVVATLMRDNYACENMEKIQPLYASDGTQAPFIDGEGQFENRWTMDVVLQSRPIVSTPQEFAAIITVTLEPTGG